MEVLYICDRKRCGKKCRGYCNHTSDIQHAANFKESENMPGVMVEIEPETNNSFWLVASVIMWAVLLIVTVATQLI